MNKKSFYKLSLWEKILICIGAFSTVLGGLYYFVYWIKWIIKHLHLDLVWENALWIGIIFLILGLSITYVVIWINSVLPYIKKLLQYLEKGKGEFKIPEKEKECPSDEEAYKSGLGEIEAYWGNRNAANIRIKDLLKSTEATEIFIAAIGFSTIEVLNDSEIISHFADLINNASFHITIVSPKDINQLKNVRPEITEEVLSQRFQKGQVLLESFKNNLSPKITTGKAVGHYVEFRCYNANAIPRHFILQDNNTIFFGSYLISETGSNSYLIELSKKSHHTEKKLFGLYNHFLNEIRGIRNDKYSTRTNI
jgi:hypothetical protein